MKNTKHHTSQQGFTLIELSIVLVIIGLIVGGVLVGQDLIRAAEIRATVSQIEKYNSAVNTFRNKYNGIPGDIRCDAAYQFGFTAGQTGSCLGTMTGARGAGDGNGLVESLAGTGDAGNIAAASDFHGEQVVFWNHLSKASLLDGSFSADAAGVGTGDPVPGTATTINNNNLWIPPAKLGRGNYIVVFANTGINWWQIQGVTAIGTGGGLTLSNAMTPVEARNIDGKLDDGLPSSGIVQATGGGGGLMAAAATSTTAGTTGDCTTGATVQTANYDVTTLSASPGTQLNCGIRIRFN